MAVPAIRNRSDIIPVSPSSLLHIPNHGYLLEKAPQIGSCPARIRFEALELPISFPSNRTI